MNAKRAPKMEAFEGKQIIKRFIEITEKIVTNFTKVRVIQNEQDPVPLPKLTESPKFWNRKFINLGQINCYIQNSKR